MAGEDTGRRGGPRERGAREYSDVGIVLRSHKLGESDKILRILTREHGKRSAVAKGVRKTSSRFGARLEPLTCARLFMHRGRNMDTIKQVEIRTSFKEVREDLDLFMCAQAMCELADSITAEDEPHPELFDLLLGALELLVEFPARAALTRALFEFKVMSASGFGLMVAGCAACGGELEEGETWFSLHLGGNICGSCRAWRAADAGKLVRVSAGATGVLSWMSTHELGDWPDGPPGAAAREAGLLMDRVLEHWMEREFRTHRVMRSMPGGTDEDSRGR